MLTRQKIVAVLKENFPQLKSNFGVKKIALFGSFLKQKETKTSDVDILIEFEKPIGFKFIDLTERIEDLLGRKIDILTPAGIDSIRIKKIARNIKRSLLYV
jgi:predicted nucleotidyltransferase